MDLVGVSSSMSEALMYAVWASVTFSEAQVSSISSCRTCQLCVVDTVIEYDTWYWFSDNWISLACFLLASHEFDFITLTLSTWAVPRVPASQSCIFSSWWRLHGGCGFPLQEKQGTWEDEGRRWRGTPTRARSWDMDIWAWELGCVPVCGDWAWSRLCLDMI